MSPRQYIVKLDDFRTVAKAKIAAEIFDYIDCATCDAGIIAGDLGDILKRDA